ncbi:Na/Pi cotransporter family protein [Fusobacterium sp. PH5-44]|uniref:Na/Pi cotransporter family protein n=1 Tax=unclassified Fusobacterium TaxID=2648384 RepID=UPI003D19D414
MQLVGGLGLFLYGMDIMSTGMRKIAGPRLKKILATLTSNRIMGIIIGIIITAFVQSSSVSTVMTIGFINASLLTLEQGLGVIFGANIGTTITGWLMALKLGKYGLPIVGIGAILLIFSKKEKHKLYATTMMGFGFIFFGLDLMSTGLSPLSKDPSFINFFHYFKADSYFGVLKAALVGALFTGVVQSSAATLGITITLATQGLIDYPTAVALVVGENVGTTVTALIASVTATANAKRAAYAHSFINVAGVVWVTALFWPYVKFLEYFVHPQTNMAGAIATSHTIFNIVNVILFTPFIKTLANFLRKIVKDKEEEFRITKLSHLMLKIPTLVTEQTKAEINTMHDKINIIFTSLSGIYKNTVKIENEFENLLNIENDLDIYEKEIADINFELMQKELMPSLVEETRGNLVVSDEYETISDYLVRVANSLDKFRLDNLELTENKKIVLDTLNGLVEEFFNKVHKAYNLKDGSLFTSAVKNYEEIKFVYREAKMEHFSIEHKDIPSKLSSGYSELLNYYRRTSDHIYNIIEHYAQI